MDPSTNEETTSFVNGGLVEARNHAKRKKPPRQTWDRNLDFILSLIGYAVGVGNLWRFPYLCMRNGGGAFLIPFFTFLLLCGIPLFYLEVCLGQFSGTSSMFVWKLCPLFKGVGYGMVIVSGMACIYYNAVLTWVIYYLVNSFSPVLPWSTCGNWWNTDTCIQPLVAADTNLTRSEYNTTYFNATHLNMVDGKSSAEEFWQYNVLRKSSGISDIGSLQLHGSLCLLAAWVLVVLCLFKGVKSLGKVVYVTVLLPYLLLTIFLVQGAMLPGSMDGVIYYIKPDFSRLKDFNVWIEACLQVFYSLGPAWGGVITMASFNKFHNNCFRDAVIVTLADGLTSFYAGFVVFCVVGFMAKEANIPIEKMALQGPGLALVAYPEAISKMPIPQLWAVLFFLMLLTLGLDSQFGMFETLVSGMLEAFPNKLGNKRLLVTSALALGSYFIALPVVTNGGIYVFQLLDWFVAAFCVLVTSFLECLIIGYLYGIDRFSSDIEMMLGKPPSIFIKICWCFITPVMMLVAFIFTVVTYTLPTLDGYVYPQFCHYIGVFIALIPTIPIPIVMVMELVKAKGTFKQRLIKSITPAPDWGPSKVEYQEKYCEQNKSRMFRPIDNILTICNKHVSVP
ncbi:sodium- and chloride-dependent glycine transporter 1-like isoform X2 [Gigantopelta aegis]|nr:sodium- and chloride-dependent glycine transporter 1-like isoform X2 [Gigantopelta aegis]XP_041376369.1 sodium- and chloride-dependent glycine transporter 1-like isoform X2 [Gigantopelta aegis]